MIDKPHVFCGLPGKQTLYFAQGSQKVDKVGKIGQDGSLCQGHQRLFRWGSHTSAAASKGMGMGCWWACDSHGLVQESSCQDPQTRQEPGQASLRDGSWGERGRGCLRKRGRNQSSGNPNRGNLSSNLVKTGSYRRGNSVCFSPTYCHIRTSPSENADVYRCLWGCWPHSPASGV